MATPTRSHFNRRVDEIRASKTYVLSFVVATECGSVDLTRSHNDELCKWESLRKFPVENLFIYFCYLILLTMRPVELLRVVHS